MNSDSITILTHIANNNGIINRETLYNAYQTKKCIISSLCMGNKPNLFLNTENNTFILTQHGFDSLRNANVTVSLIRESLPDYTRNVQRRQRINTTVTENGNVQNMIEISIDRNEYLKIKVTVHENFKTWIKANGTKQNFYEMYGSETLRNWDATQTTEYYHIDLKNLDENVRGSTRIIDAFGLNPLILKLACGNENNSYEVKYKGLVSWENVLAYAQKFSDSLTFFYKNYVKPFNLKINVQFTV